MKYINKKVIESVAPEIIQHAVQNAYQLMLEKKFNMPDRMHVGDKDNTLLLMPCFTADMFATKLVSVFPKAPDHGMPAVNGILVLSDNTTGCPLAVMDGAAITAGRTGAVGGLGVACLTPENIRTGGIIGAGVQGLSQAKFLLHNRRLAELWVSDLHRESAEGMVRTLEKDYSHVDFRIADRPRDLVAASEVVIAATTALTPLFESDAGLVKGKTFISIGSFRPEMQEFPNAVIETADRVFTDTPFAAEESGDIRIPLGSGVVPKEKIEPFAGLVHAGGKGALFETTGLPGGKTYFFKSVGMALFDLTVASVIYEQAKKRDLGQLLET